MRTSLLVIFVFLATAAADAGDGGDNRARTGSVRGAGLRLAPWEALVLELPRR